MSTIKFRMGPAAMKILLLFALIATLSMMAHVGARQMVERKPA